MQGEGITAEKVGQSEGGVWRGEIGGWMVEIRGGGAGVSRLVAQSG